MRSKEETIEIVEAIGAEYGPYRADAIRAVTNAARESLTMQSRILQLTAEVRRLTELAEERARDEGRMMDERNEAFASRAKVVIERDNERAAAAAYQQLAEQRGGDILRLKDELAARSKELDSEKENKAAAIREWAKETVELKRQLNEAKKSHADGRVDELEKLAAKILGAKCAVAYITKGPWRTVDEYVLSLEDCLKSAMRECTDLRADHGRLLAEKRHSDARVDELAKQIETAAAMAERLRSDAQTCGCIWTTDPDGERSCKRCGNFPMSDNPMESKGPKVKAVDDPDLVDASFELPVLQGMIYTPDLMDHRAVIECPVCHCLLLERWGICGRCEEEVE